MPERRQRAGSAESRPREGGAADLELMRGVLAGDSAAIAELVARLECLPALVRARNRRLSSPLGPDELEDVVQGSLLALWRKLEGFDGRSSLESWAYGFASMELVKSIERRARRVQRTEALEGLEAPAPTPEEPAFDVERLHASVQCLVERDREILRLRHGEGLTFEQIATRLEMVANTVKTRYYRSLARLRKLLERRGEASPG